MVARTSPEAARHTMVQAGLMPLTDYVDAKSPWPCRCLKCGHEYNSTYDRAKQGRGCPKCANVARIEASAVARRIPRSTLDEIFAKLNLELLGEYKSSNVPLSLRCLKCGDSFQGVLRKQKSGYSVSCPTCSDRTKRERFEPFENELNELLKREGAQLLDTAPTNKFSKIHVKCSAGHIFSTTLLGALGRESFCHDCTAKRHGPLKGFSRKVKLDLDEIRTKLENHSWVLLQEPTTVSEDVQLSCALCGRQSHSRLHRAYSGSFVCQCRKDAKKRESVLEILTPILEQNQGKLISAVPMRTKDYGTFECAKGHQWSAVLGSVTGGTWCAICSGNAMLSLSDIVDVVSARGGTLLSDEYLGVDAKYLYQCNLGHQWEARFSKIKKGQWCPTCSKSGVSEEVARTTFEQIFGVKFPKVRPKWLRNEDGFQMELDGYSKELGIAFEYQGRQHFERVGLYGGNLEKRIADDKHKLSLCESHGVRLVYLNDNESYSDFPKLIKQRLAKTGQDLSGYNFEAKINLDLAYIRVDRLNELRQILAGKNIKLHSTKWISTAHLYDLECLTCGHHWKAKGHAFFNSRRVSGCKKCAMKAVAGANRHSIDVLHDFAKTFGGAVLSNEYKGRNSSYEWRCKAGHVFNGGFNNMKFRNVFCPTCDERQVKDLVPEDEAIMFFRRKHLEPIEPYVGKRKYIRVRCTVCSVESKQNYMNLAEDMPPCKNCEHLRKAEEAAAVMVAAGVRPLEPYVNVTTKWLCECLTCHNRVTPTYVNVKRGGGPCIFCGRAKGAKKRYGKG